MYLTTLQNYVIGFLIALTTAFPHLLTARQGFEASAT